MLPTALDSPALQVISYQRRVYSIPARKVAGAGDAGLLERSNDSIWVRVESPCNRDGRFASNVSGNQLFVCHRGMVTQNDAS
jgi:hypothetical protein